MSNYIGRFVGLATAFLLTPFILQQLGASLYGLWVLVGSVVAYGSLLDLGIAGAVTKYVAEYQARGELEEARGLVATALTLYSFSGLLVTLASIAVAPAFPSLFRVSPEHSAIAVWAVLISGASMSLTIMSASTTAVLRGLARFDLMNLLSVTATLLMAGATVIVLLLGGGVIALVCVSPIVNLLVQVPAIWLIYRVAPELRFGLASPSRRMVRTVTSFSASLFMIRVGGQLETRTDEIVVGAFLPVTAVTPYNLARKLSSLPQMLSEQFLSPLLPLASELHTEDSQARLRSVYIASTRLTLAVFLAGGISLVVLAGPLLTIWVGAEFGDYAYLVSILTIASFIDTSQWPAGFLLQGMAKHRFTGIMALCSGTANLVLSVILVPRLGLTGVALGTLVPTTIIGLGFVMPYAMRVIGVTGQEMYRYAFVPAFVPIIPAYLAAYLLRNVVQPTAIIPTLFVAAVGAALYLIVYLRARSCEFERDLLRDLATGMVSYALDIRKKSREGTW